MQVSPVLANLVKHWVNLETSLGAISRLTLFMKETPSEPTDEDEATVALPELWPNGGNIELVDVSSEHVTAEGRNVALRDISISIKGGTKVGLVGRTGSGKSSLFLTLLNFLPYTGEVRIDGIEISDIPRHAIRSRITTTTQDLIDLPGSARDNIIPQDMNKAAGSRVDDVVIVDALRQVGLTDIILSRGGLGATLEDIGLSNGQKLLLALARAIIHNGQTKSKVVLVDEATSGFDTECEEKLQTVMAEVF